jgi:endonuclease/exonuclease/phosphatase (EEP) superfamily protein YafD
VKRFRLISANLWNGGADPSAFADLVERLRADVVAVQELTARQAEALARVMPHGLLEPDAKYRGMGVALRRPGKVRRIPLACRDARMAEIHVGDGPGADGVVEIINVHVQAPHSPPTWGSFRRRRLQLRGLERYLEAHPGRRRAVVGDLNATPLWPLYRRLAARLTDAAVETASRQSRRPRPTWGPWPGAPRLLRIDHALVSGLTVGDFRVVPVVGADHSAIVVDLSID